MKNIGALLFEAKSLKDIPRSGYHFLGAGKESVAEHVFSTTFVAYVIAQLEPDADALKLVTMCLLHDLPEARIGDLNYVQKQYVTANESKAVEDTIKGLPFGKTLANLIIEFNQGKSLEAKLARDADQLSFILELKSLADTGCRTSSKWLSAVTKRLQTETGKKIAESIMTTDKDSWWEKNYVDRENINK